MWRRLWAWGPGELYSLLWPRPSSTPRCASGPTQRHNWKNKPRHTCHRWWAGPFPCQEQQGPACPKFSSMPRSRGAPTGRDDCSAWNLAAQTEEALTAGHIDGGGGWGGRVEPLPPRIPPSPTNEEERPLFQDGACFLSILNTAPEIILFLVGFKTCTYRRC